MTPIHTLFCLGLAASAAATSGAASPIDAKEVFVAQCAPCHGADGKASTPAGKKLGAKDLSESKLADDAIQQQITTGKKDAKGAERMPAFKERLSPEEIAALVGYVKSFRR